MPDVFAQIAAAPLPMLESIAGAAAGFTVSPLRSYGLVETSTPALTLTWVDRGADALVARGQIGKDLAAALKAEAKGASRATRSSATWRMRV